VFGIIWFVAGNAGLSGVETVAEYLTIINISVGIFNLLPGFPLDGGRILRSIVWSRKRNLLDATRVAANGGRLIAGLMIAGGVYIIISGIPLSGFWLIFIGLFLWNAAESSYQQLLLSTSLGGVKVGSVLDPNVPRIPPTASLRTFANEYILRQNRRAFFVAPEEGDILGIVTLSDLRKVPEDQWDSVTVYRAMTPREKMLIVSPFTDAISALQLMGEHDINQVPVINGRDTVGLVTRGDLVRAIQLRSEIRT
jgi:CBS domain-containing protein